MGRPRKHIENSQLLRLRGENKTLKEIAAEMNVSCTTLSRRLAILNNAGFFTKHRHLERLRLTGLKARLLAAIDLDHLEKANIVDLANALYAITKAEIAIRGKAAGKVGGLVGYLHALESQRSKGNGYS